MHQRASKAKPWVLDTGTKGTGAEMVPLEKALDKAAPDRAPFVPPTPRPRPAAAPEPSRPRRFKVVDALGGRVLEHDVDARAALAALAGVRNMIDVRVYVWQPRARRWRLLTIAEQKAMWANRYLTSSDSIVREK